jgi:multidrug transporter EmrE-like cation transporter
LRESLAIAIAIVAALLLNWAIYLQKKAVLDLPEVKAKISWTLVKAFITNKPWMLAQIVNVSGFALYSVALALAPVSIVEPIIASGVVLLAYLAIKNLDEKPRRIDYFAMSASVLGVIFLGVSLAEGIPKDVLRHPLEIWFVAAGVLLLAVVIPIFMRGGSNNTQAAGLGVSVGLFFGMAAVFQRLLMLNIGHNWVLVVVFIAACIATYVPAFIILQAALQKGMAMVVAPIYNGLMEFVPIVLGMAVLNEGFPQSNVLKVLRILAFALILMGTVILSQRAEGDELPEPAITVEDHAAET